MTIATLKRTIKFMFGQSLVKGTKVEITQRDKTSCFVRKMDNPNIEYIVSNEALKKGGALKIYVLVKMFQGIHDGVELFRDEKASERAYKKYTRQKYPADGNFENIHEDFRDTIIQVTKGR